MKVTASKETIIRTAILVLAIINNALALFGKSPLPIDDETLANIVSFLFVTISALVSWWYNNSFTEPAILADRFMENLKQKREEGELSGGE